MFRLIGGLFLGWSLGANDSANLFGPGVYSRLIRYRTAVILIAVFVMLGAALEGPKCMDSLGELGVLGINRAFLTTLAAAIAMTILTFFEIPASTSQAIVGAIMGATLISSHPNWDQFFKMVVCWVLTPIGGAVFAFVFYKLADLIVSRYFASSRRFEMFLKFTLLIAGSYGAYALGANNVANTTALYVHSGMVRPFTGAVIGGAAIAVGAITYSKKVMHTVGAKITLIGPVGAVVATLAHSVTIHMFTQVGVPVSSSQAIVGAVMGIGLVRGIKVVNYKVLVQIFIGWLMTPFASGILAYVFIYIMMLVI